MICENQKKKKIKESVLGIMLLWLSACTQQTQKEVTPEVIDLYEIRNRNSLIVSIDHNSVDYFIYKGEPMGFQYEILSELGKHFGLKVEMRTGKSYADNLQSLSEGCCDMIVSGLIANIDSSKTANSAMLYLDQKVLIQRKPALWRKMTTEQVERTLVRDPEDLNGKMVYTSGWSPLEDGTDFVAGRHIKFVTLKEIEPEALINLVAEGELDYAVCKYSIARLIMERYPDLDMQTQLGELPVGWMMRASSVALQDAINQWLNNFRKTNKYGVLYKKYHESKTLLFNVNTKYFASRTGVISEYDDLFRKYSAEIGWDWRLLASLVCQESNFKSRARSKKGAYGLMQMMPSTLEFFGIDTTASPEKHIAAGVKYIKYLDKMLSETISDTDERVKFVLASYNIGPGHVMDAQRLAEKYGKDATVWDNSVDSCLLNKADPKYYKDPEVRYGRCKGKETYAFVSQIMKRYEHYKNIN